MEYIIVERSTGALVTSGYDVPQIAAQQAREGQLMIPFPHASIIALDIPQAHPGIKVRVPDVEVLKPMLCDLVDEEAGAALAPFYTNIIGQDERYAEKRREATAWAPGASEDDPDLYPFMVAEAEECGVSVAQVRAEVIARLAQRPTIARIEARRRGAKRRVVAATISFDAITATNVDWSALPSVETPTVESGE